MTRANRGELACSLDHFTQQLRDYQVDLLRDCFDWAESITGEPPGPGRRCMYESPTGTGKGTAELAMLLEALRRGFRNPMIVTPSLEVVRSFLQRTGMPDLDGVSEARLWAEADAIRVTTPTRLRNRIIEGAWSAPDFLIYDEGHHATETNQVSGDLFACCPYAIFVALTATAYRGSPKSTALLTEAWGRIVTVMDWPEAVEEGWVAQPRCSVVPLVDDDEIKVSGGEFQVKRAGAAYLTRLDALAALVASYASGGRFDKPTMASVPSTDVARELARKLELEHGLAAHPVLQATSTRDRSRAYQACLDAAAALVQITVVSEGVDLPALGRIVDARPTMSPVSWMQQFGRVARPFEGYAKEYVCTCRNLERYAFLLAGCLPPAVIRDAQQAFGAPSKRASHRHVGLESLGRHKPIPVPLADGRTASMHCVYEVSPEDGRKVEWVALVIPGQADALIARRIIGRNEDGTYDYAARPKWERRAQLPVELRGFRTTPARGPLTDKMEAFWRRCAARKGLHPDVDEVKLTRKQFQALPVLMDTGMRVEVSR